MVLKIKRYHLLTLFKVILVVPLCIFIFIAASGYFFGGTPTTFVSWFVIVPLLTVFLSKIISGRENSAFKSLISLLTVYGVMIFMIYKHYQTDFFKVMIVSLIFNALVLLIAGFAGAWSRNTAK
jgi:hypothetical protein